MSRRLAAIALPWIVAPWILTGAVAPDSSWSTPDAQACGYSSFEVLRAPLHPDLPLTRFAGGDIDLLGKQFARSYLVVAYRTLVGLSPDDAERDSMSRLWARRLGPRAAWGADAPPPEPPRTDAAQAWIAARQNALDSAADSAAGPASIDTRFVSDFARVDNCLDGAFEHASDLLAARISTFGPGSPQVLDFIRAQDFVFAQCGRKGPELPPTARTDVADASLAAHDLAYQLAAAAFYRGDYLTSAEAFQAVAADGQNPHAAVAAYAVARAHTRAAGTMDGAESTAQLRLALEQLRRVGAEPRFSSMHEAAQDYETIVRARLEPDALAEDIGVKLGTERLGAGLGAAVDTYTHALDRRQALDPFDPSYRDRLTTWVLAVQSEDPKAFDTSYRLYDETGADAWLVAALMTAEPTADPRVVRLLDDAKRIAPRHPAFATVHYHRLTLEASILRTPSEHLFDDARATFDALDPDVSTSTRNAFTELLFGLAPSFAHALPYATARPAGITDDHVVVLPLEGDSPLQRGETFHPEAARVLSDSVPLSGLLAGAEDNALPEDARRQLAAIAWTRAEALGKTETAAALRPVLASLWPELTPHIEAVHQSPSDPERRQKFLMTLAQLPSLSIDAAGFRSPSPDPIAWSSHDSSLLWCHRDAPTSRSRPWWTLDEQRALDEEQRRLHQLGAGPTYLAFSAAELAKESTPPAELAELLHLAVRATRFGCRDPRSTEASRSAFSVLHAKFPDDPWTEKTPYYY